MKMPLSRPYYFHINPLYFVMVVLEILIQTEIEVAVQISALQVGIVVAIDVAVKAEIEALTPSWVQCLAGPELQSDSLPHRVPLAQPQHPIPSDDFHTLPSHALASPPAEAHNPRPSP
jgi:hypothetical protein